MWSHGTVYGYDGCGCRCAECTAAKRAHRQLYRIRARETRSASYLAELEGSRQRKERYKGTCKCGASTNGSAGPGKAPARCVRCANADTMLRRRGIGSVSTPALALIAAGVPRADIRRQLGISDGYMSVLLNRLQRHGLVRRVARGRYSIATTEEE